ncbi:MAG: hypothetical protein AMJ90_08770 [candidate division Zixibacteria bacterium SM23_73_2]|nr:MAG: hypothetical protein AMJ90_08770 [candidate division Zixibacteria bacterium SM23_73_2]
MDKLFDKLPRIKTKISKKSMIFIGLDYDGTLTPIVEHPDLALLPKDTRLILRELSNMKNAMISIVSGRSYKDIRKKVGIKKIIYVGNHGFEMKISNFTRKGKFPDFIKDPKKYKEKIEEICRNLERGLKELKGVWVENKGITASVHYRLAKTSNVQKAKTKVFSEIKTYDGLKLAFGKKVWQIKPKKNWNKGEAIRCILERNLSENWRKKASLIYMGDDRTDEDVFSLLKQGGITILVSKNPKIESRARYSIENHKNVLRFLVWLRDVWEEKIANSQ